MLSYRLKCRKHPESKEKVGRCKNGKIMLLSSIQCVLVQSWYFLKNKKLENYYVA